MLQGTNVGRIQMGRPAAIYSWIDLAAMAWTQSLDPIARLPNEKNVGCDQDADDEHPVLDFEAQKREMLNKELHRRHFLFFRQDSGFDSKNILFLYFDGPVCVSWQALVGPDLVSLDGVLQMSAVDLSR